MVGVILIWFMLAYQLLLFVMGFYYSRRSWSEQKRVAGLHLPLPSLSILIPAHNEALVIRQTLQSILASQYPADLMEVLVIDDGSLDGTADIVREVMSQDTRVRLVEIPQGMGGRGKAAALNAALPLVHNEIIGVFDADNRPEPDSLWHLAVHLMADPKLGGVIGKFRAINRYENLLLRFLNIESLSFQWIIQAGRCQLFRLCTLPGTNFLVRKSLLMRLGGWDERALTEDAELTIRIYEAGSALKFVPSAVTWEQEPRTIQTWIRQRTRWVRGNNYVLRKFAGQLFQFKPRTIGLELLYSISLYYVFFVAIVLSDLLFLCSASGLVMIAVPGPYQEVWIAALILFVLEILLAISREPDEDSIWNFPLVVLMYFTYCQLWLWVVCRGFYEDFILRREMKWAKTERYVA